MEMWKERVRARELNGVLVRAVGSSGSMTRWRLYLRDTSSVEREIVGQVAGLATTSEKKENEDKSGMKNARARIRISREKSSLRCY